MPDMVHLSSAFLTLLQKELQLLLLSSLFSLKLSNVKIYRPLINYSRTQNEFKIKNLGWLRVLPVE